MENNNIEKSKKKHFYSIKEKLAILDYYKAVDENGQKLHSKTEVLKKFNLNHKTLEYWEQNETKFKNADNSNKKTLHKGKASSFTSDEEKTILQAIENAISEHIPLYYNDATKLIKQLNIESIKNIALPSIYMRVYRFLKKNYYVKKKGIPLGQSLPNDATQKAILFLKQVQNIRKRYNISLSRIINLDETQVSIDNPNSFCLDKKEAKIISIKALAKEKNRITCLLTITASGNKLQPYIAFKGQIKRAIYNDLQKIEEAKEKKVFLTTQCNALIDQDLFIDYIYKVIIPYKQNKNKLLIMDVCPAHFTQNVLDYLQSNGIYYVFIPERMTMVLQPLVRSINYPFKKYLKQLFSEYIFNKEEINSKELLTESRRRIIKDICKVWYGKKDDETYYISKESIENSFLITGISNKLDGTEDHLFDGFEVINNLLYNKKENTKDIEIKEEDSISLDEENGNK